MKEFDDLINEWQNIKEDNYVSKKTSNNESIMEKLKKLQRKIVFSNLIMSVSFAVTFIVLGWIWSAFPNEGNSFYLSIIGVGVLLIFTLFIQWYRVIFWKTPSSISENLKEFSSKALIKLKFNKWISNIYMPAYTVILGLLIYFYMDYVLEKASFMFKFWAYTITFSWIIGFGSFSIFRKWQMNKKELDPLIEELQELNDIFKENTEE